jgi:hypothetical protein
LKNVERRSQILRLSGYGLDPARKYRWLSLHRHQQYRHAPLWIGWWPRCGKAGRLGPPKKAGCLTCTGRFETSRPTTETRQNLF